jgi:hypothetical protein
MSANTADLITDLQAYGVSRESLRLFDGSIEPEHCINYLDLIGEARRNTELLPDGVAESQGRPLLYFINESRLSESDDEKDHQFYRLRRSIANRGDRAYLARIFPGRLEVIPVSPGQQEPNWKIYEAGSNAALTFFSRLALGHYDDEDDSVDADFVFQRMFKLVENASAELIGHGVQTSDRLSLIGRTLFFRFLLDRSVITDLSHIVPNLLDPRTCFDNAHNAFQASQWLDITFNGDFLPLTDCGSKTFFDQLNPAVFKALGAILRSEEAVGQGKYQLTLNFEKWGDFDFAHVPIGLLSQVYEAFCWQCEPDNSKSTSVHYTPRNIASMMVDEAFDGIADAHQCRVLDPACGAAVFLVLAFRRLYRERWQATGKRPATKDIRAILENQLVGFDISDSALKLAALSLYLTAIELDPNPIPPENLRFNSLKDSVLFNHRRPSIDPNEGPVIGSLGEHVGDRFDGQFDIVLSNPPWTGLNSLKDKARKELLSTAFTRISQEIIERKAEPDLAKKYKNPYFTPDLPFLWKSTEWCKPGGCIAMALPTRILFKLKDIPRKARETVFRLLEVTGIINGSNLTDTKVWPNMQQPFMLLFSRNQRPKQRHQLYFITPHYDTTLNNKGELRIDFKSTISIDVEVSFQYPWLLKILAIGTTLDLQVIQQIYQANGKPLKAYWEKDLCLVNSNGYKIGENQKQNNALFLYDFPDLNSTKVFRFLVEHKALPPFTRTTLARPRKLEVYKAPLALILEAPGETRTEGFALLALNDIAYNESFYGYSAAKHPQGELLVRYIHLFIHSGLWIHYSQLITPQFGSERRTIDKSILDEFPIIPFENLTEIQLNQIKSLSEQLIDSNGENPAIFKEIDSFFGNLYGLDKLDLEVIHDTLEVCSPYKQSRDRACDPPTDTELEIFRQRLELILKPFFTIVDEELEVTLWNPKTTNLRNPSPFGMILIGKRGRSIQQPDAIFQKLILKLADDTGTSLIFQSVEGGLIVGILNQYRYWTPSRARLLGAEIVRDHLDKFEE